jgi:hypothetical protein
LAWQSGRQRSRRLIVWLTRKPTSTSAKREPRHCTERRALWHFVPEFGGPAFVEIGGAASRAVRIASSARGDGIARFANGASEPGPCAEDGGARSTDCRHRPEIENPLNFVNNFAGLSVEFPDELKAATAHAISALTSTAGGWMG